MEALLNVEDLRVSIPVSSGLLEPVRGISFQVGRGETFCIVGESGCGKSLTSLSLMNLLPQGATRTARKLEFQGTDLTTLSPRRMADLRGSRMAMIFQEPMTSLNPAYTVGNLLEEVYLRHKHGTRREARDRAVYLLERVGITAASQRLRQYAHQLSGGLRQRVLIAMALMCGPDLIIADEPTTALDVTIQAQILRMLADLQAEFDMGLILITHDLGVVARIADRVAVMYAGSIVEVADSVELFENPMHPYTQGLLNCIPVPGRVRPDEPLGSIPGLVPTLVGDLHGCLFRNRCPHARAACAEYEEMQTASTSGDRAAYHGYRCIQSEEQCRRNQDRLVAA